MLYTGETIMLKSNNGNVDYQVKQINTITANKLHDLGVKIWLHPCNLTLKNVWQEPYSYQRTDNNTECFISIKNSFEYYNCDTKRGKRVLFFAECDNKGKLVK